MDREAMWFLIACVLGLTAAIVSYNLRPRSPTEQKVDAYRECITQRNDIRPDIKICEELTK